MENNKKISVLSPLYNGENTVKELVLRISKELEGENYEIVLICDGSPDKTLETALSLTNDPHVKVVELDRNYGQHYAIHQGLNYVTGDFIIVMDCDLQDDPQVIKQLLLYKSENHSVVVKRQKRRDGLIKKLTSKGFYHTLKLVSGITIDSRTANYGIYPKSLIERILKSTYYFNYFPVSVAENSDSISFIDGIHQPRLAGESGYNFSKRLSLALRILHNYVPFPINILLILIFTGGIYKTLELIGLVAKTNHWDLIKIGLALIAFYALISLIFFSIKTLIEIRKERKVKVKNTYNC